MKKQKKSSFSLALVRVLGVYPRAIPPGKLDADETEGRGKKSEGELFPPALLRVLGDYPYPISLRNWTRTRRRDADEKTKKRLSYPKKALATELTENTEKNHSIVKADSVDSVLCSENSQIFIHSG